MGKSLLTRQNIWQKLGKLKIYWETIFEINNTDHQKSFADRQIQHFYKINLQQKLQNALDIWEAKQFSYYLDWFVKKGDVHFQTRIFKLPDSRCITEIGQILGWCLFYAKVWAKGAFLLSRVKMVTRPLYGIQIIHFLWLSVLKRVQPSTSQYSPAQPSTAQ